jgi:hypothetical protein
MNNNMQNLITKINKLLDPNNSKSDIDNAVEIEKYVYENMPKRLITDSIARMLAGKNGVVAAYLELEKSKTNELNQRPKDIVKQIFVCSKNQSNQKNKLNGET